MKRERERERARERYRDEEREREGEREGERRREGESGGLGLHRLALEAPLIALAHHLSHRAARACQGLHNAEPTPLETQAWNQTMLLLSVPTALKNTEAVIFLDKGYRQAMEALRKELYDDLAEPQISRPNRRLAATGGCCFALPGLEPPQELALALAWWAYPRSSFVSDPVLQLTLRDRFELQVQQVQACQYTCRSTNRMCGAHLVSLSLSLSLSAFSLSLALSHSVYVPFYIYLYNPSIFCVYIYVCISLSLFLSSLTTIPSVPP